MAATTRLTLDDLQVGAVVRYIGGHHKGSLAEIVGAGSTGVRWQYKMQTHNHVHSGSGGGSRYWYDTFDYLSSVAIIERAAPDGAKVELTSIDDSFNEDFVLAWHDAERTLDDVCQQFEISHDEAQSLAARLGAGKKATPAAITEQPAPVEYSRSHPLITRAREVVNGQHHKMREDELIGLAEAFGLTQSGWAVIVDRCDKEQIEELSGGAVTPLRAKFFNEHFNIAIRNGRRTAFDLPPDFRFGQGYQAPTGFRFTRVGIGEKSAPATHPTRESRQHAGTKPGPVIRHHVKPAGMVDPDDNLAVMKKQRDLLVAQIDGYRNTAERIRAELATAESTLAEGERRLGRLNFAIESLEA